MILYIAVSVKNTEYPSQGIQNLSFMKDGEIIHQVNQHESLEKDSVTWDCFM